MSPRPGWAVFLLFACLYTLSIGRGFYSSDGEVMFKTSAALAQRGSLALEPDPGLPQIVRGSDGRWYGKYDPGLPLLGVPFFAAGDWVAQVNAAHRTRLAAISFLLLPALAGAGTLVGLFGLARSVYGVRGALAVTLVAGLATILWPYARLLFAESVLACALTVSVMLIVAPGQRRGLAAGVVFGLGMLTRAALAIYALPLATLIVRSEHCTVRRAIRLGLFVAGALPGGLGLLWHNDLRFGDPLRFGYAREGFTAPLWEGVAGLLISPGKSVFLYAPPLILSVVLWPRFQRVSPPLADFLALAWIMALPFYGMWWAWHGGYCWGPRLLVPLVPLSCLPLGVLFEQRERGERPAYTQRPASAGRAVPWARLAFAALIALGAGQQMLAVATDTVPHYAAVVRDDQSRYRVANFAPRYAPPLAAIRRLGRGHTEPLALFHLAGSGLPPTWTVGAPLLVLIGLGAGIGGVLRLLAGDRRRPWCV